MNWSQFRLLSLKTKLYWRELNLTLVWTTMQMQLVHLSSLQEETGTQSSTLEDPCWEDATRMHCCWCLTIHSGYLWDQRPTHLCSNFHSLRFDGWPVVWYGNLFGFETLLCSLYFSLRPSFLDSVHLSSFIYANNLNGLNLSACITEIWKSLSSSLPLPLAC